MAITTVILRDSKDIESVGVALVGAHGVYHRRRRIHTERDAVENVAVIPYDVSRPQFAYCWRVRFGWG